jgi:hypothetical protein
MANAKSRKSSHTFSVAGSHILLLSICLNTGCSELYIHSESRETKTVEGKQAFQSIQENSSIEKIILNHKELTNQEENLISLITDMDDKTQLWTLHDSKWSSLEDDTKSELSITESKIESTKFSKLQKEAELKEALKKLPLIQKESIDFIEAINEASLAKSKFEATQILLKESLLTTLLSEPKSKVEERIKNLSQPSVLITEYEFTKNGKLIEKEATKKSVTELLSLGLPFSITADLINQQTDPQERIKKIIKNTIKHGIPENANFIFNDPGINVKILNLLQDFSRAEEERVKLEIEYSRIFVKQFEENIIFLETHRNRLKSELEGDDIGITRAFSIIKDRNSTVGNTIAKFSQKCQSSSMKSQSIECQQVRAIFRAIAINYENRIVDKVNNDKLDTKIAELEKLIAIENSRVNITERESLISRGLEGLLEFHQSGIDENDVKNIIALAQTIGVAVIAGGVY